MQKYDKRRDLNKELDVFLPLFEKNHTYNTSPLFAKNFFLDFPSESADNKKTKSTAQICSQETINFLFQSNVYEIKNNK